MSKIIESIDSLLTEIEEINEQKATQIIVRVIVTAEKKGRDPNDVRVMDISNALKRGLKAEGWKIKNLNVSAYS